METNWRGLVVLNGSSGDKGQGQVPAQEVGEVGRV